MAFIDLATSSVWGFVSSAVPFLAVLTLIVFIHEYGHFKIARMCGVGIDTFAVGFGREIIGKTDKHGTRWKLGWIPIGGYVKFEDDANAASMPENGEPAEPAGPPSETAFHNKPLASRAAVVAAGPIANFILAIFIYTLTFMYVGEYVGQPVAGKIKPDSAAQAAGMQAGDRIASIDGRDIEKFSDIQAMVMNNQGDAMAVVVDRDGKLLDLSITPQLTKQPDPTGGTMDVRLLGIQSSETKLEQKNFPESVVLAGKKTWFIITSTLNYVKGMIVGRESATQLAGPIRIAQVSGHAAANGINSLLQLAALLSVSIGLINLFPIPMLDGGHLMYYALEAVRGKPLGQTAQDLGFKVGFAMVLTLMIVATWNDIARFFTSAG